jgi:hypothetical protein
MANTFGGGIIDLDTAITVDARVIADVVLRERTGQRRTLRLTREALPFRPVSITRASRMDATEHQGSVDTTIQQYGPRWEPIQLRGSWRVVWLNRGLVTLETPGAGRKPLLTAVDVVTAVNSMWLEGQDLDFVWDTVQFRVVIDRFETPYHRREDIDWSLSLRVIGPGGVDAVSEFVAEAQFVKDAGTLLSRLSGWLTTARKAIASVQAYERVATNALDRVDLLNRELQSLVAAAGNLAETPARLASRTKQTGLALGGAWRSFCATLNSVDAAYSSDGSALGLTQAQRARVTAVSAGRKGEADAVLLVAKVRQSESPIVRVFTSSAVTDLRNVAREQYGRAAQWTVIAKASGLSTPRPPVGTTILVPASPQ